MSSNWTFDHDDHSPFGSDEYIYINEYRSLIITIILFLIGLFGNIIILIINGYIIRYSYDDEKRTFENFLIEISCFDLIILFYHLINSIIRYKSLSEYHINTMIGLINISTVCCKLLTYIIRISTLMSHWLIILLIINRLFLVYSKFYRFITIINAKYAVLGLLFIFTLSNVPSIESMSYNEPFIHLSNSTNNITFSRHCLMNAEMIDLQASIYSTAVIINVFCYNILGLILPIIIIFILSIFIFQKGSHIWNELHINNSERENISLQSNSPIIEYLRTYNTTFILGITFVLLSIPCKLLRLIILFSSNNILLQAHIYMQTIGHTFELLLYSYKCFIYCFTNYRFRCALKYILKYKHNQIIINQRHSQDSVPFETLYKHLQINEFELPIKNSRPSITTEIYSHRLSFKTRSSVCSRRTKEEDEISL